MRHTVGAPDAPRSLLPAGDYRFAVREVETKFNSGDEMFVLALDLFPGGTGDQPAVGRTFDRLIDRASVAWKTDAFLASLHQAPTIGTSIELTPASLKGKTGRLRLKIKPFEGEERNEVAHYIANSAPVAATPPPSPPAPPPAAAPPQPPAAAGWPSAPQKATNPADDIPFP